MPYPDQMLVVGGYRALTGLSPQCVGGSIIQVFNLTSASWLDSYDPTKHGNYGVPDVVVKAIGGDGNGGATMTAPSGTGFATPDLASVFRTAYPTTKIPTHYPYSPSKGQNNTNPDITPVAQSGSGVPTFLPPLLGVICGLMFVSAIGVIILLYRRRRLLRRGGTSEAGTDENGNRIISWIRGQPSENKAPTVTTSTEDTPLSPETETTSPMSQMPGYHHQNLGPQELGNTQFYEMPGRSKFLCAANRAVDKKWDSHCSGVFG